MIDRRPTYRPPAFLRSGHLQTILPSLVRRVAGVAYHRERVDTPDGDFLDLDWSIIGSRRLGIVSHGLEGNAGRAYVLGMVRALNQGGIDAVAWNQRGCSGEPNRTVRMYHNGVIDDLDLVVRHAAARNQYQAVYLIGFSLGGNLSLLYLGKLADALPGVVKRAVAFSVPCDLADASVQLEKRANAPYMRRFLVMLHHKILAKQHRFPEALDDSGYHHIKTFKQFDDRYTAPIHGFRDALDYWRRCSSKPWIGAIRIPTLIVNAQDDPFLGPGCYPDAACANHRHATLRVPRWGGHVGFMALDRTGCYWSERQALDFLNA